MSGKHTRVDEPTTITLELTPDDWRDVQQAFAHDSAVYEKLRRAVEAAQRARLLLRGGVPVPVVEKRCSKCGVVKPVEEFYWTTSGRRWRYPWCKRCHNALRVRASQRRKAEAAQAGREE